MLSFALQPVMYKTFKAAFADVGSVLEEKLSVSYGLLNEPVSYTHLTLPTKRIV